MLRVEYDDAKKELTLYLDDGYGGSNGEGGVAELSIRLAGDISFQHVRNRYGL